MVIAASRVKVRRTMTRQGSSAAMRNSRASAAVGRAASIEYCARHSAVLSNSTCVGVVRVKSLSR